MEIRNINTNTSVNKSDAMTQTPRMKSNDKGADGLVDNQVDMPLKKEINKDELNSAVDRANRVLFKNDTHLKFEIHEKTKDIMVKVINNETGETLKEFPPEKILDMVAKLWEIAGLFVDEKR